MKYILGILTALLVATSAHAQSGSSVKQSGNITPGHIPYWVSNDIIGDGGTASDSPLTTLGVTSNTTAGFCVSSGRSTAAGRQQLCMGAPLNAPGVISVQNYGTATAQGLNLVINGTTVSFPSSVGGDIITGTGPYTAAHVPCFIDTTGSITDCGLSLSSGTVTSGVWGATPVAVNFGGTGAATASSARTNLGLGTMATQDASNVAIIGGTITGIPIPTVPSDVATKQYVDGLSAGLNILAPSNLATTTVLPNTPTYSNGASGVGATLTAGSNTTLTIDSVSATLGFVILVKNQAAPAQNGIYTVTTAGSGAAPWVLTRATYFDQAAEMLAGSYTFISNGATNINTSYTLQSLVSVVGTSPISFVQFSAGPSGTVTSAVISAGAGMAATGTCTITTTGTCTVANNNSMGASKFQVFTTGSGTITTPTNAAWAKFTLVGGGGGGGGGDGESILASSGGSTCISASGSACVSPLYSATGGTRGVINSTGGAGGTVGGSSSCTISLDGSYGGPSGAPGPQGQFGGKGGTSFLGLAGDGGSVGNSAPSNSGGGGQGGATITVGHFAGAGGGGGGTCIAFVQSPASSYTYVIGTGGTGSISTGTFNGGTGGSGLLIAEFGFN